jgi:transmembrane protein EpsG
MLKKENFGKYLLGILIASLFHNSAIVLLIVYPFVNINIKEKYKILIAVLLGTGLFFLIKTNIIFVYIYKYFPSYEYKYLNIGSELNSNYTVFIISSFCLLIAMLYKKNFYSKEPEYSYQISFLILLCLFAFLATLNPMFGRMLEYFMPAISLIIPSLIDLFNDRKQKLLALTICTIFFSIIYIM